MQGYLSHVKTIQVNLFKAWETMEKEFNKTLRETLGGVFGMEFDDAVYALDYYFYGPIRRLNEQLWAKIENLAVSDDEFCDKSQKYIRTELMFPKKKKRGTMRRRRRERKTE